MEESLGQFYLCVHSLGRLFTTIQETLTRCMHDGTMAQIETSPKICQLHVVYLEMLAKSYVASLFRGSTHGEP